MVNYNSRKKFLQTESKHQLIPPKPILKCLPPPKFQQLKQVILKQFKPIKHLVDHPSLLLLDTKHYWTS